MANKKQALKYIRKTETRTAHNRSIRSRLKTLNRRVAGLSEDATDEEKQKAGRALISAYEKASKRGIVHPNRVSKKKADIAKLIS